MQFVFVMFCTAQFDEKPLPISCEVTWSSCCDDTEQHKTCGIWLDCVVFLGSTMPTMAISTGQNGADCLEDWQATCAALQTRCRTFYVQSTQKKKKKNNVIKLYWVFHSIFFYLTANTRLDVVQNFMLRYVWKWMTCYFCVDYSTPRRCSCQPAPCTVGGIVVKTTTVSGNSST